LVVDYQIHVIGLPILKKKIPWKTTIEVKGVGKEDKEIWGDLDFCVLI
jgi:hypothetical protein